LLAFEPWSHILTPCFRSGTSFFPAAGVACCRYSVLFESRYESSASSLSFKPGLDFLPRNLLYHSSSWFMFLFYYFAVFSFLSNKIGLSFVFLRVQCGYGMRVRRMTRSFFPGTKLDLYVLSSSDTSSGWGWLLTGFDDFVGI
jgi:hypothetical protein